MACFEVERTEVVPGLGPRVHPRVRGAACVLAVLVVAAGLYALDPGRLPVWVRCPFHMFTGLHCPGCGTLRALHALLHGRVVQALGLNALTVGLLPFLAYPFLSNVLLAVRGRGLRRVHLPTVWGRLLVAAIIAFWIIRNIPVHPFTLLAP